MIKYVLFDLDETLIDIKKAQNSAGEKLFMRYGFNNHTTLQDFLKTWDELTEYHYAFYTKKEISYEEQRIRRIRDLFNKYNVGLVHSESETYDEYLIDFENSWCLFDDVLPTIEELYNSEYKLGVISNGDLKQQKQKLEKTKILNYMTIVTTSSEYSFSKPDTRLYEEVCKKNNIKYDELCYVGDSLDKDIFPCLNLGIKAIWINRNKKQIDNQLVIQINSLEELFNIIK